MKIGVIGAGTMGQGIAKAFAQVEGNTVALCDIKQEWAENGLAKIKKGYEKLVAKGKMTQEKADAIVAAITPGLKEDLCADCDLVVEPWRCLCLGFSQITMILPLRLITLHFSQIFLTEGLTFICAPSLLVKSSFRLL